MKEGTCRHEWGIDGAHSNEYCKRCFASKAKMEGSMTCPACGKGCLYHPPSGVHACSDPRCVNAHGVKEGTRCECREWGCPCVPCLDAAGYPDLKKPEAKMETTCPRGDFRKELERLINRHCIENGSNTPDFILADYLMACLAIFENTTKVREHWYGRAALNGNTCHPASKSTPESAPELSSGQHKMNDSAHDTPTTQSGDITKDSGAARMQSNPPEDML